jgi:hypothetical protein
MAGPMSGPLLRLPARLTAGLGGLGVVLGLLGSGSARAQSVDEKSCRVDYSIEVKAEPDDKRLAGHEEIRWRNETRDDVPDLWFHLYWNAFANDQSTHLQESGGELKGVRIEDGWGWQRVTSLRVDGVDLLPQLRWRQPDDGRIEDRTVFSVALPKPARAGDVVAIEIAWEARIPRVRRRTGQKDDFLLVAQWFPKLGVYEQGNGWNCHQFHANTEFFSDYGSYDVRIDLPARYEGRVGASGVMVEPSRVTNGRVLSHFVAPSPQDQRTPDSTGKSPLVHDFAWTADSKYVVHRDTFHYDAWAKRYEDEITRVGLALGRGREELRLRDVAVTVLLQPEHASQGARHFDAACAALFFYGLWFGGYPYEHVTVVDPAWGAGGASGMEYPTLLTAGTRMHTFQSMHSPESVTLHETGHQFWYGLVGNNEFEAGWLDEGFNTYTQNEALIRHYGERHQTTDFAGRPFDGVAVAREPGGGTIGDWLALRKAELPFGVELAPIGPGGGFVDLWRAQPWLAFARMLDEPRATDRSGYLSDPDSDPIDMQGWRYVDRASYRNNSYRRPATMLRTLCGLVGEERFLQGMRAYSEQWRYAHPYAQDFFAAFQKGAQVDVSWFFESAFESTETVDWQLSVDQTKESEPAGWFLASNGAFEKRSGAKEPEPEDGAGSSAKGDAEHGWKIDVLVRRKGEFLLPLKIELAYEDGRRESLVWSREEQARSTWWRPLEGRDPSPKKLSSARLDPDGRYTLDTDLSNNQWFAEKDTRTPLRWSERVLAQYAQLLHWYGGIGG